jgi:curved DNA-binding protein CbpA
MTLSLEEAMQMFLVKETSSWAEVRARYRALALIHHPDKGGLKEYFQKVQDCYDVLFVFFTEKRKAEKSEAASASAKDCTQDDCFQQSNMTAEEFESFLVTKKEEEELARRMKAKEEERKLAVESSLKTPAAWRNYIRELERERFTSYYLRKECHQKYVNDLRSKNLPINHIPRFPNVMPPLDISEEGKKRFAELEKLEENKILENAAIMHQLAKEMLNSC